MPNHPSDAIRGALAPYYVLLDWWLSISPTRQFPIVTFKEFKISNFRGVSSATLNLEQNDMILLLGLNESGKTTILKAIETFDCRNDPVLNKQDPKEEAKAFFTAIRNKSDITSDKSTIITAKISLEGEIDVEGQEKFAKKTLTDNSPDPKEIKSMKSFLESVNRDGEVTISRVIPFNSGRPKKSFYRFESPLAFAKGKTLLSQIIIISYYGN